ncbi:MULTISPECIES: HD domain-containing protein [unclassified Sinorhizobium]|uniref:HD domain-containing protein n=1 Tax=unclassified Sinorhizobium TaxID=2613772 RepID=UPI003526BC02
MTVDELTGVRIPDSKLARDVTQFIRDTESVFLFEHSSRVYFWGALAAGRKGLTLDPELFYTAAMFHDVGLTAGFRESRLRFEVDGANAARDFLRSHGVSEADIEKVWLAIALHTTPGISTHLHPIVALTAEGVMMDLVGLGYDEFTDAQRRAVEAAYPHSPQFAEDVLQSLYDGLKHRPETTQRTGLADVIADKEPHFHRQNFCSLMRNSRWVARNDREHSAGSK